MAVSSEYVDFVVGLLETCGSVRTKKMFGGVGIYLDEVFMAIIASDELYFKTGPSNLKDFEAKGMAPFKPFDDKEMTMSYSLVPAEVMEQHEEFETWATKAFAAAIAAKKK